MIAMASSAVAQVAPDSTGSDSLKYPIRDRSQSDFDDIHQFDFKDPNNLRTDVTYNPDDHTYSLTRKVGDNRIGNPEQKTFDEYLEYQQKQAERE